MTTRCLMGVVVEYEAPSEAVADENEPLSKMHMINKTPKNILKTFLLPIDMQKIVS